MSEPTARDAVVAALDGDPDLTDLDRQVLLAGYDAAVTTRRKQRERD